MTLVNLSKAYLDIIFYFIAFFMHEQRGTNHEAYLVGFERRPKEKENPPFLQTARRCSILNVRLWISHGSYEEEGGGGGGGDAR